MNKYDLAESVVGLHLEQASDGTNTDMHMVAVMLLFLAPYLSDEDGEAVCSVANKHISQHKLEEQADTFEQVRSQ